MKTESQTVTSQLFELFNNKKYSQLAYENRFIYQENKPYPHIFFDDFLPLNVANSVSKSYTKINKAKENYKFHNHKDASRYFIDDTNEFSTNLKVFASVLSSRSFLLFLETLTGINSLIPDPYFMGGGAMVTNTGGHLNIHVDFNWNQKLQLWRRVNVLFYLTEDWKEDYGGNLELWSKDGKNKIKDIVPLYNRVVIFNTSSNSYHGQPGLVSCPKDKFRHVFSVFYYSREIGEETESFPHFTRYLQDERKHKAEFESSPYSRAINENYLKNVIK
jgi:Rps23 Pro-64 3,4-dihydroxylase Tpa1-like proline 4-hydroxylase